MSISETLQNKYQVSYEAIEASKVRFPEMTSLQYGFAIGYDEAMAVMREEFLGLMTIIVETHSHVTKAELVNAMVETLREFGHE